MAAAALGRRPGKRDMPQFLPRAHRSIGRPRQPQGGDGVIVGCMRAAWNGAENGVKPRFVPVSARKDKSACRTLRGEWCSIALQQIRSSEVVLVW